MVASMTAFGRSRANLVEWQVRSVNHRYLELAFRLPEPLRDLEPTLRELAAARLSRGKVDASLRLADDAVLPRRLCQPALDTLLAAIAQVRARAPAVTTDALAVLQWPGVLANDDRDVAECRRQALDAYRAALDDLLAQRQNEGRQIARLLDQQLAEAAAIAKIARQLAAAQQPALKERLCGKLRELTVRVDAERLEQEVAFLVQRADVTEELDRLDMHLAAARDSLAREEPCGQRLDFLMQEIGREANTLAAKAALPELAQQAVDLKVAVQRLREQVQNIE